MAFYNGKSQPTATIFPGYRILCLPETFKYTFQFFLFIPIPVSYILISVLTVPSDIPLLLMLIKMPPLFVNFTVSCRPGLTVPGKPFTASPSSHIGQ